MLKEELAKDPDNVSKEYRVVFAEGRGVAWSTSEEETSNKRKGSESAGCGRLGAQEHAINTQVGQWSGVRLLVCLSVWLEICGYKMTMT